MNRHANDKNSKYKQASGCVRTMDYLHELECSLPDRCTIYFLYMIYVYKTSTFPDSHFKRLLKPQQKLVNTTSFGSLKDPLRGL